MNSLPKGEEAAGNSGSGNGKGFTGRDRVGNGLLYFRNRMYSPLLGRFISEDPLGWEAGPNFFAYCHNDPINFNDPLGLAESDPFLCGRGDACAYSGGFKSVPYGRPEDYEERRAAIDEAMSSALIGIALSMDMGNHGSPNERILGFRGGGYFRFTGGKGSYSGGGPRTLKGPHNTIRRVIPDKGQAGETDFDTGIITLSRPGIKHFARVNNNTFREELYSTYFHEAYHQGTLPYEKLISSFTGVDPYSIPKLKVIIEKNADAYAAKMTARRLL